jgi:hypothetical protein
MIIAIVASVALIVLPQTTSKVQSDPFVISARVVPSSSGDVASTVLSVTIRNDSDATRNLQFVYSGGFVEKIEVKDDTGHLLEPTVFGKQFLDFSISRVWMKGFEPNEEWSQDVPLGKMFNLVRGKHYSVIAGIWKINNAGHTVEQEVHVHPTSDSVDFVVGQK